MGSFDIRPRVALLLALATTFSCAQRETTPKHVVLVVFDTLRADRMSLYGHHRPTTPFFESMAPEAVVFERFKAVAPWTLPTHATMFSGTAPAKHRAQWGSMRLADEEVTLAETLSRRSFCSAGLSANPLVKPGNGVAQGFGTWEHVGGPWTERTDTILKRLPEILEHARREQCRLFLFLNLMDTHIPYNSSRFGSEFGAAGPGPIRNAAVKWAVSAGTRTLSTDEWREHRSAYDAAVRAADEAARNLVATLGRTGFLEESLLVFTSDHGEGLGLHSEVGHSISVWEEQLAIPLVVRFPRQRSGGRRVSPLRSQLQLAPSILDWLAIERPATMETITNLLTGPEPTVFADYRSYFSEGNRKTNVRVADNHPELAARIHHQHVTYCDEIKAIVSADGGRAAFDLSADPHEENDLLTGTADPRVRSCFADYRDFLRRGLLTPFEVADPVSEEEPDLESLRALGYVQ